LRYGGNTPCVEIRCGPYTLIFDAGTGIRPLGNALSQSANGTGFDIFLSHGHIDHVIGLPFFAPLFMEGQTVRVWAGSLQPAGGTSAVLVASTFERRRRSCLLDYHGGSRRRGLCLFSHRWLDGRRLGYSGYGWSSFLIREPEGRILCVRGRRIKPWTKRNDLGRIRRPVAGEHSKSP
jgi:ribonuclease BN (tRNA processing enzyme)